MRASRRTSARFPRSPGSARSPRSTWPSMAPHRCGRRRRCRSGRGRPPALHRGRPCGRAGGDRCWRGHDRAGQPRRSAGSGRRRDPDGSDRERPGARPQDRGHRRALDSRLGRRVDAGRLEGRDRARGRRGRRLRRPIRAGSDAGIARPARATSPQRPRSTTSRSIGSRGRSTTRSAGSSDCSMPSRRWPW